MVKQPQNVPFDVLRNGFELAVTNAFSLVMSAIGLLADFPHVGLGLAQLGQEEVGKSFGILAAIALSDDESDWQSFWRDWKDHRVKASRAFFYELFNPMRLEFCTPSGQRFAGLTQRASMPAEKEASFYVNFDQMSSITLLSRVKDYFLEFGSAPLAAAALPHQIGLHRPENLFPRHTRSFFWCAGRQ